MHSRTVRLSHGSVRYLEAGEGRPMVLLHAFPLGAQQWSPQLSSPPPGWRLIAPDLRGFGESAPSGAQGVSMDTYASDVFALIDHLDVPDATVVGLSMGGYVALAMLARDSRRISGLVLADTRATADGADARAARDRMVEIVRREGPSAVANEMLGKLLGETTRRERPEQLDAVRRLIESNGPDGIEAAILAMKDRADHSMLLGSIACPTIVICGVEDVITKPEECEGMSRHIRGSRFVPIPGAGHLSNLEAPAAFGAALRTAE